MAEREGEWECVRCGQDGCVSVSGGTGDFWQTSLLSSASALTKPGLVGGSNKTRTGPHWPHSNGVPEPHHELLAGKSTTELALGCFGEVGEGNDGGTYR